MKLEFEVLKRLLLLAVGKEQQRERLVGGAEHVVVGIQCLSRLLLCLRSRDVVACCDWAKWTATKETWRIFCYISAAAIDVKRVKRWLHTPTDSVNFGSRRGPTEKLFLLFQRDNTRPIRLGQVNASRISAKSNVTTSEARNEWDFFPYGTRSRMNGQQRPK